MQPPNHIPYTSAAQGDKRRPTTMYTGRNGFAQVEHSNASDVVKHNRFLENKRFADFVLQSRGSGISIDDMEKELQQLTEDERPKDREAGKTAITRTEARIVKLQEEQVAELEKMYGMEAQDYLDEMEHRYYSRLHEPAVLDAEKHMEKLSSHADARPPQWDDQYTRLRHAQLQDMLPLYRQLARLQPRQGSTQAEPRVFFPKSSEEYKTITSKETRLRIAHFLTIHSNDSQREAMMNRFNWVYRQVDPLRQEFEKDEEFHKLVTDEYQQTASTDPRKRR